MGTLTVLDWPRLLSTPDTRWYLDRDDWAADMGQCACQDDCTNPVVAGFVFQVAVLPGHALPGEHCESSWDYQDLVCAHHLPDLITHATGEPLVAGTVVEVGVDPALLRLTGVDPAVVARFNDGALGCSA